MGDARHQSSEGGELLGLDKRFLGVAQTLQRRFCCVPCPSELTFIE